MVGGLPGSRSISESAGMGLAGNEFLNEGERSSDDKIPGSGSST
jgi:hypothetical protein